jgi:hypothetical protein
MERLRQKDAQAGVEQRPRTEAQKAAIAEVRSLYEAKLAQAEVMYRSHVVRASDAAVQQAIDAEYYRERQHLTEERDGKIEKIRNS